nr:MAG TPA: hypothetical protein [Bacteriophage sp.]
MSECPCWWANSIITASIVSRCNMATPQRSGYFRHTLIVLNWNNQRLSIH